MTTATLSRSSLGKPKTTKSCKVCLKKGCTEWTSGAFSCRTKRAGRKGEIERGMVFAKTDNVGLGLWVPFVEKKRSDKGLSTTEVRVLQESRANSKPQESQLQTATQAAPKRVSLAKRDEQFRRWAFDKSSLCTESLFDLRRRGLNDEQIQSIIWDGLIWDASWGDNSEHADLPGKWDVKKPGYSGAKGMAIACVQRLKEAGDALVLGAQVQTDKAFRARRNKSGEAGAKYLWMSTTDEKQGRSANIKQFGNANPITVHETDNPKKAHIVVTEGILKPLIAKMRGEKTHGIDLGCAVIGAAGTVWGSDGVFGQIKAQCKLLGAHTVHLALDAGAVVNPSVMMGAAKFAHACFKAGIGFKVIWYSQISKSAGDIDELSSPTFYELKTMNEITQISNALLGELTEAEQTKKNYRPDEKVVCPLTATKGYERDFGYLPNHLDELAPAIFDHKLACIRSGKGTGKTQLARKIVEACHEDNRPVILFTHRLRLGESLGALLGLPLKYEVKEMGEYLGFVITVDSSHKTSGMRFSGESVSRNALVLIDEVDQVFWHMVYGKTAIRHHRDEVIQEVSIAMQRAENVLVMSADATDREVSLVKHVIGDKNCSTLSIANTHQRDLGDVVIYNSAMEVVCGMKEALDEGGRFMAKLSGQKADSLTGTQTLSLWLKQNCPDKRALIFDSESLTDMSMEVTSEAGTSRRVGMLEYISHPDEATKLRRQSEVFGKYDYVFFTNVCSTGVSFEAGRFSHFFQIEQGVGSVYDALQATARYRPTNVKRAIFVSNRGLSTIGSGSTNPGELSKSKDLNWARQAMLLAEAGADWINFDPIEYMNPISRWWSNYAIVRGCEYNEHSYAYRDAFVEGLKREGYNVAEGHNGLWLAMSDNERRLFKESVRYWRDKNMTQYDKAIAEMDIEGVDFEALKKKRDRSKKEDRQLEKQSIVERYGVAAEDVTPQLIEADRDGVYHRLLMRMYLEAGSAEIAKRDKAELSEALNEGRTWASDLLSRSHAHKVQLMEEIGVPGLIEGLTKKVHGRNPTTHRYDKLVTDLVEAAGQRRDEIKQTLGIVVGHVESEVVDGKRVDTVVVPKPMLLVRSLLGKLDLSIESLGQIKANDKRVHKYRLIDKLSHKKPKAKRAVDYALLKATVEAQDAERIANESVHEPKHSTSRVWGELSTVVSNRSIEQPATVSTIAC